MTLQSTFMELVLAFSSLLIFSFTCEALGARYKLVSMVESTDGRSFTGQLELNAKTSLYGPDIQHLRIMARYESYDRLRVYITDAEKQRWEVPEELVPRHEGGDNSKKTPELQFSYTKNPFGFAITRRSNGEVLFNSTAEGHDSEYPFGNMVFKDQYLEISTVLPKTASLYGVGESTRPGFRLDQNGSHHTLWNLDILSWNKYVDTYGSQPFYMDVREGGLAHGVLLLNSNGMDIDYGKKFKQYLQYKVIGGVLDFYFFAGPSPLSVVQQFTGLVGRPAPMPYWTFGFHQGRYGYRNISDLKSVLAGYAAAELPLEAIWVDIDYMNDYKDFTLDPVNFPEKEMKQFVQEIHANGQKCVPIVDPGISIEKTYNSSQRGIEDDIFVKRAGVPYLGQVWPGASYFPDFLNPKTESFWTKEISLFLEKVPFDGLWLDMNEVSNFCSGTTCSLPKDTECPVKHGEPECCLVCNDANTTKWDDPPYKINVSGIRRPLGVKTIATSAVHYNDVLEYNVHNLYGLSQSRITNKALKTVVNKRPFVLARSNFIGSGAHAAHWTGDYDSTWDDLQCSIPAMLNFGLFGVPMMGADICGFAKNTTEELCNRWVQLGAFYPFARDHSDMKTSTRQELYLWRSVTESAKKALGLRYRLLPYIYTLSYEAHTKGFPIVRPLFFTFPEDANTLVISTQFLLGKGVLISPVVKEGATTVEAYLTKGTWYNLFNVSDSITMEKGSYVELQAPLDTINVHVYEGTILPMQEMAMTTSESRKSPFSLVVALGSRMEASGELYLDNGMDMEMKLVSGRSSYVEFYANVVEGGISLRSVVQTGEYAVKEGWTLQTVTFLGFNSSGFPLVISNLYLPIGKSFELIFHHESFNPVQSM